MDAVLTTYFFKKLLIVITVILFSYLVHANIAIAAEDLPEPLTQIEKRIQEESKIEPSGPNSLTYLRAIGQLPSRNISPRQFKGKRSLTLEDCLQMAFANSNEIEQSRQKLFSVGGAKLITNSRFLPSIEIINQYEHFRNFSSENISDDTYSTSVKISQRLFEYGKDNPLDITLRLQQQDSLFNYENKVANVFSSVRRAFFFIKLKDQQIVTRQKLLEEFERQYQVKQQRMKAGNLSVKVEVLTARLNVLNERTRINTLKRQKFNQKMDLLRLIGLPVGADQVEFNGQLDVFALDSFDVNSMSHLALSQSSEVGLAEAIVAEQQRRLDQLHYEYTPDLRFSAGYKSENGQLGADIINQEDTWGLDLVGQPKVPGLDEDRSRSLGLFSDEFTLGGPDAGWFAGFQIRIPLFEGRSREGKRIELKSALMEALAVLNDKKDRIELAVRQNYKFLMEQKFQVELEQERVAIAKERLSIKEQLREIGKITDDELETFRNSFFAAQDNLFQEQEILIQRQEDLRLVIRYFK